MKENRINFFLANKINIKILINVILNLAQPKLKIN